LPCPPPVRPVPLLPTAGRMSSPQTKRPPTSQTKPRIICRTDPRWGQTNPRKSQTDPRKSQTDPRKNQTYPSSYQTDPRWSRTRARICQSTSQKKMLPPPRLHQSKKVRSIPNPTGHSRIVWTKRPTCPSRTRWRPISGLEAWTRRPPQSSVLLCSVSTAASTERGRQTRPLCSLWPLEHCLNLAMVILYTDKKRKKNFPYIYGNSAWSSWKVIYE
jgi:hypothetical protein